MHSIIFCQKGTRAAKNQKASKFPLHLKPIRSKEMFASHERQHQGPRKVLVQQGAHQQPLPEWHVGDMGVYTPFSGWKGIWLLLTQPT